MRCLGYRPDPQDDRDFKLGALRLPVGVPLSATLEPFIVEILDQLNTNSCVANAWAQALRVAGCVNGTARPPLPSRLYLYSNSRAFHGEAHIDDGTFLRTCGSGVIKFGAPPEHVYPFETARVNERPPWAAYRAGFDFRGSRGYYRIAMGDLSGIRQALAAQKPVVFGVSVPDSFLSSDGPSTVDFTNEPIVGGHAMVVVGYEGDRFRICNSWGADWRERGLCWFTEKMMARAMDLWAVDY
jgi:hypothetical protein